MSKREREVEELQQNITTKRQCYEEERDYYNKCRAEFNGIFVELEMEVNSGGYDSRKRNNLIMRLADKQKECDIWMNRIEYKLEKIDDLEIEVTKLKSN